MQIGEASGLKMGLATRDAFGRMLEELGETLKAAVLSGTLSEEDAIREARGHENVQKYIKGKEVKKEGYVEGKLVSLVV